MFRNLYKNDLLYIIKFYNKQLKSDKVVLLASLKLTEKLPKIWMQCNKSEERVLSVGVMQKTISVKITLHKSFFVHFYIKYQVIKSMQSNPCITKSR